MLALIPTSAVRAAEVRVMISAGFFHVYSELAPAFERGLVRADSKVVLARSQIGFQQVSEVMNVPGTTYVGTIPAELQPGFTFAGAVTSRAAQPEAARALLEYLSSSEAAPIVTKAGLAPPRRAGHGTRFPTRRLLSLDPRWCAKFHCNDPCLAVYRETCVSGGRPPCD